MPTVASIMDMARLQCNKTASMSWLSNADLLPFLNAFVYSRTQDAIRKRVDGEYFTYTYNANIVADQDKYLIPQADATTPWVLSIIEVGIKTASTDEYFTVLKEKWEKYTDKFLDYDAVNASPMYYDKRNWYIYIYPTPPANVTWGLKILWSVTLPDLETTSTEADVFPNHQELRQYSSVLVAGMREVIYQIAWDSELKGIARQEYNEELDNMCWSLQKWMSAIQQEEFIWDQYY